MKHLKKFNEMIRTIEIGDHVITDIGNVQSPFHHINGVVVNKRGDSCLVDLSENGTDFLETHRNVLYDNTELHNMGGTCKWFDSNQLYRDVTPEPTNEDYDYEEEYEEETSKFKRLLSRIDATQEDFKYYVGCIKRRGRKRTYSWEMDGEFKGFNDHQSALNYIDSLKARGISEEDIDIITPAAYAEIKKIRNQRV